MDSRSTRPAASKPVSKPAPGRESGAPSGVRARYLAVWAAALLLLGLAWWWAPFHGAPSGSTAPAAHATRDAGTRAHETALPLHGPRVLVGMVQDDRGEPLAEALLRVSSLAAPALAAREVRTDSSGTFRFDNLPLEPLAVEVTRSGHEGKEHMLHAGDSEPLTFVLARQGELHVALRDSPGRSVAATEVVLTGPGVWPAQAGRTDARGELVFKGLAAGDYRVRARREARVALPLETVAVIPGKRTATELVLSEGATLSGVVVDLQTRKPLPHASVSIQDLTPGIDALDVATDAQGEFSARGLWPGAVRIDAQQDGFASATRDLVLPLRERVELALAGAASLAGIIVDEAGRPVAGARLSVSTDEGLPVELSREAKSKLDGGVGELGVTLGPVPALPLFQGNEFALGTLATESDGAGHFLIGRLSPVPLALHVARPGYVAERVVVEELKPHEARSDLRVVLREAGRVVGRVLDARGRALSGVYVAARSGEREQSALTDGAGEYTLRDLLGEVLVEAQPDGHSTLRCRAEVQARAEARCDLTADVALHALNVRVVDAYGIGIEGALVSVSASAAPEAGAARVASTQLTRRDGTLILRDLPAPPPYLLDVKRAGHLSIEDLPIRDAEHEVRIRLARAATLAGFVVDTLGRAVPSAFVSTEEGEASDDTDAEGGFLLDGVAPGTHSLVGHHARAGDGRSAEVRARPSERLDGVRIVLNGRYDSTAEADGGTRLEERTEKPEYALEQRGRVLVLTQVMAGSPAARAGLRVGDVLSAIDGEMPLSAAHARGLLRDPSGRTAVVRVLRNRRAVNLRYRRPAL
ncbi:MAG: hypothetical protein JWN48_4005 [Myxococcaceae bacterium]|nr:hypothetical protein [Myxococcaceae bacterium]